MMIGTQKEIDSSEHLGKFVLQSTIDICRMLMMTNGCNAILMILSETIYDRMISFFQVSFPHVYHIDM